MIKTKPESRAGKNAVESVMIKTKPESRAGKNAVDGEANKSNPHRGKEQNERKFS
jgi:hypothetical protein